MWTSQGAGPDAGIEMMDGHLDEDAQPKKNCAGASSIISRSTNPVTQSTGDVDIEGNSTENLYVKKKTNKFIRFTEVYVINKTGSADEGKWYPLKSFRSSINGDCAVVWWCVRHGKKGRKESLVMPAMSRLSSLLYMLVLFLLFFKVNEEDERKRWKSELAYF